MKITHEMEKDPHFKWCKIYARKMGVPIEDFLEINIRSLRREIASRKQSLDSLKDLLEAQENRYAIEVSWLRMLNGNTPLVTTKKKRTSKKKTDQVQERLF